MPGLEQVFYRTGDLVHLRPDGDLVFIGRKDRQVKVRGYRVELDEIEARLGDIDGLEECAVYFFKDDDGNGRIEGAATIKSGAELKETDLLKHVRGRLPRYAVPARLDLIESFPRTSSGKIDRRQLQIQQTQNSEQS